MAKTKTPFLSLGSSGTVGGVLTSQKSGGVTILRKTPVPTDPYSLAQAYQRWDYRDYAYLWTLLTNSEKQVYRTRASRYHITGYSLWMREHLKDLPDLAGRWHLDEKAGTIAYDSSKYLTHGVIFGTSPIHGLINGAQYFTIDDFIKIIAPQLNFTSGDFSLVAKIRISTLTAARRLFTRGAINVDGWYAYIGTAGFLAVVTSQLGAFQLSRGTVGSISTATWYTVGFSRRGASIRCFLNGVDNTQAPAVHINPATSTRTAKIGIHDNEIFEPWEDTIDHLVIYNRYLSDTEHKRHSERSYP